MSKKPNLILGVLVTVTGANLAYIATVLTIYS